MCELTIDEIITIISIAVTCIDIALSIISMIAKR